MANEERFKLYRTALRTELEALQKATTGSATIAATTSGYTRSSGSFLADGFSPGDEVKAVGFASALSYVKAVSALSMSTQSPLTAGAGTRLEANLPLGRKYQGYVYTPVVPKPWVRETFKIITADRKSVEEHAAMVRDEGLWQIDFFYPIGYGSDAADVWANKFCALFYPGRPIVYNGVAVTIRSSLPVTPLEEAPWVQAPMSVRFFANSYTP